MGSPNAGILANGQDKAEQLEQLLAAAVNPTASALTVVSGTALQDTTGLPSAVYVSVIGGASGTVTVAIGPTNATATTIVASSDATLTRTTHFRLPAGWFFKVTVGGSAAIASAEQVVGG